MMLFKTSPATFQPNLQKTQFLRNNNFVIIYKSMGEENQSEQQKNLQVGTDLTKEATKTVGKKVAKETGKQVVKQIGKQAAARAGQAVATNVAGGTVGGVGTAGAGGAAGAAAGGAATGGVVAAESNPVGWIITIIIIIIVLIILIIIMFSGGSSITCTGGISADSNTVSIANPTTITVGGCPDNVVYTWSEDPSTPLGGSFEPLGQASTVYTPPAVTINTSVIIDAKVCSDSTQNNCSSYSVTLQVVPATCSQLGGTCTSKAICTANGIGTFQGASDCVTSPGGTPQVCCNFGTGVATLNPKFFCQYTRSYTNCTLNCSTGSSTCSNPPTTCGIEWGGCVPTSVTMVLASFGITGKNPDITARDAVNLGGLSSNSVGCLCSGAYAPSWGMEISKVSNGLLHMSTKNLASGGNLSAGAVRTWIDQGCLILSAADMYFWSSGHYSTSHGGHETVIVGVDSNGVLKVFDPTFCSSDTKYTVRYYTTALYSGNPATNPVVSWWYVQPVCPT
jgi:hypothetical protein